MDEEEINLTVLTLNCWGIPYVSKDRIHRMNAIAEKLVDEDYDIVCLQEIWSITDFNMMRTCTLKKFPHSHYFYSGVIGSGVCLLSRYPIEDVIFHKWPLNGYVHKIHHGDWFGGKGVGLCRIRVKDALVNVYIAHLHAEYCRENDEYTAHRVLQAFDTAQFIRMTRGVADAVILGGDLNTEPQDLAYQIICSVAGLLDACGQGSLNLGTNECARNSYTNLHIARKMPQGKRIDHILYRGSPHYKMKVNDFRHPFPERVPDSDFSYSDHEAVMANFKLIKGENKMSSSNNKGHMKEALQICENALRNVRRQRIWYLFASCILAIPLLWSVGLEYSTNNLPLTIFFGFIRLILTGVLCYAFFMGTLWNNVEQNALKAGCSAMEVYLMKSACNYETDYAR